MHTDRETCAKLSSVWSYVMQQMPHPHCKEAMNNCDNHCTMASFINVWGAQMFGRLGCLSIFWSGGLFSLKHQTGVSAEWCHRWHLSCPCAFVLSLTHKERNKSLWICTWIWLSENDEYSPRHLSTVTALPVTYSKVVLHVKPHCFHILQLVWAKWNAVISILWFVNNRHSETITWTFNIHRGKIIKIILWKVCITCAGVFKHLKKFWKKKKDAAT